MKKGEIIKVLKSAKKIEEKVLLGKEAYHFFGSASKKEFFPFIAVAETENFFVGCWYNSYLMNVAFSKKTTKKITIKDFQYLKSRGFEIRNFTH